VDSGFTLYRGGSYLPAQATQMIPRTSLLAASILSVIAVNAAQVGAIPTSALLKPDKSKANAAANAKLALAIKSNDAAGVTAALKSGADPNLAVDDGTTALTASCIAGKFDQVNALLAAGASAKRADKQGNPPLFAVLNFRVRGKTLKVARRIVALLLEHGADPNARSYSGYAPINLVTDYDIVASLVKKGANVDAVVARHGITALMRAAGAGRPSIGIGEANEVESVSSRQDQGR
jgi:ankyrin repeat protein